MSEPEPSQDGPRFLAVGLLGTVLTGGFVDLVTLLLIPVRVHGQLLPVAAVLVLVGNASLGLVAGWALRSTAPAKVLVGLALLLSVTAASSGPGGDLLVTRELQGAYLVYVVAATLGACLPLVPALAGRRRD